MPAIVLQLGDLRATLRDWSSGRLDGMWIDEHEDGPPVLSVEPLLDEDLSGRPLTWRMLDRSPISVRLGCEQATLRYELVKDGIVSKMVLMDWPRWKAEGSHGLRFSVPSTWLESSAIDPGTNVLRMRDPSRGSEAELRWKDDGVHTTVTVQPAIVGKLVDDARVSVELMLPHTVHPDPTQATINTSLEWAWRCTKP